MAFELVPATEADIAIMGEIFAAAFATDTHTQMKMKAKGEGINELEHMMDGALKQWIPHPHRTVTKAIEITTGTTAGWVCWARHGYETPIIADAERQQEKHELPKDQVVEADVPKDPIERLGSITNGDMNRWITKVMPKGVRCLFINAIVVHPSFQSRGVGSALIQKGTTEADKDGVFCWVHASEAGHKTFAKQGFEEKERLEIDLDEFATATPADKDNWGLYTFRYMVRLPKQ